MFLQVDNLREDWNKMDERVSMATKCAHTTIKLWTEIDHSQTKLHLTLAKAQEVCQEPIKCSNREETEKLLKSHEVWKYMYLIYLFTMQVQYHYQKMTHIVSNPV